MTYDEAVALRSLQLHGKPVDAPLLEEAIEVIRKNASVLPKLERPEGKREAHRARLRAAAEADMRTKVEVANMGLLAKLQRRMPHWRPSA